ncbi:thioredoxin fold domain-containing protein [Flavobacterium sp. SE-s28]|uniref:Thioredoxin fold domain-containing protein n=2 Tax=Flavobacterium silvaticum TaxID=1852020 RepID=A0A972JIS9_9FLAO|nr:thioredoxin fold domain-containing protein [Flavobacterium silvaticum]
MTGLLIVGCNGQPAKTAELLSPTDFAQKIKQSPDAQVLDVRTPEEFDGQHLDNALNLDWYEQDAFSKKTANLDKSKPVFVYCMAGSRSHKAALKLSEMGFEKVYDMKGGIVKWNAEGLSGDAATAKIYGICPTEYSDMLASADKILVDFYAPWCEPCKKMAPYLTQMEKDSSKVKIVRLNADEHKTMMKELEISELPTLILYDKGTQTWKHSGYISEEDLKKQLK